MVYTKQSWVDGDLTRPISAARLTNIENGIGGAHDLAATKLASADAPEVVRDTMGTALVVAFGGRKAVDDVADTVTLQTGALRWDTTTSAWVVWPLIVDDVDPATRATPPPVTDYIWINTGSA